LRHIIIFVGKKAMSNHKDLINQAWENHELLNEQETQNAIRETIAQLDSGAIRVAQPSGEEWQVNDWVKRAVILFFRIQQMEVIETPPFEYHDKVPLKTGYKEKGIRVVPNAMARYGSYISKGVVMMPSYVNIGAYVDEGTMVDNWTTVGSCAQIGKNIHLSASVVIGGVLEPVQAAPVIIEDNVFVGAQSLIVEGVRVQKEAVIAANVSITKSTKIIDVSGDKPIEYKGIVPSGSVVIPGSYAKKFPAGEFQVSCALIIGKRKASTDAKTSLNEALRDFNAS
jgi:2,3,4,5-tetrahydropyridine-2-carboxylate N-succinyltransferase